MAKSLGKFKMPTGLLTASGLIERVLIAAIAASGSYFAFKGDKLAVEPTYVKELQNELRVMRGELTKTQSQILALTIQNADLTRQLGGSVDEIQLEGVFTYIDSIKRPAWCKRIVHSGTDAPIKFEMAYLNYSYELVYGVSVRKYIGQTDFDNHPQEVAKEYYENDMLTYRAKDYREFLEPTSDNENYNGQRRFAKFFVALPTGPQLICGIQVNAMTSGGQG